jgi:hypothetical protein
MAWRSVARCGVALSGARCGGARETAKWKGNCGGGCVRRAWLCLAARACVGSMCWRRLARSFVECGGGGVACVWLNVDVDGSGGGEGEGSRMKGKRKKNSWLDEWKKRCIMMR